MSKKLLLISMVLLGAVLLSACGGSVRGTTWPGLAVDETTAYLSDLTFVYGINLSDGKEVWRFADPDDNKAQFYSTPVITPDGLAIVGSAAGKHILYALNPADLVTNKDIKNPAIEWMFTGAKGPWVAAPLVIGDLLFAPNSDGNLYVLNLNDGQSQKQAVKVVELAGRLWAQPVTDGERVFITSLDHSVYAVDVATYNILWHEDVAGAIPGSPAIGSDGMLYVGSLDPQLEQFDPKTGQHKSALATKNWIWSTPVADGDMLYFGDLDGNFYSFNTSTGTLNWSIQPDGAITASAILQNDHLLLATESGNIYAIEKETGKTLWFEQIDNKDDAGKIYTTPVIAGDNILVASLETEYYLAALDSNGRQVWTFIPGK
ncbi:MAG: PQQ-binding-like beta-propeller repeat protein [Anaerolineales bacterium]|nr:PQQ-binding-like beta-propeller repeat protein [Anaerolineales bacterium]